MVAMILPSNYVERTDATSVFFHRFSHDVPNPARYTHQPDCGSRRRELALKIEECKGERRKRASSNLYSASQPCERVMLYIYKAVGKKAEVGGSVMPVCMLSH
jgi:hypothetical protein